MTLCFSSTPLVWCPQSAPDLNDGGCGDAIALRQSLAALARGTNFLTLFISKLSARVLFAKPRRAVPQSISRVFRSRCPTEVSRTIVIAASVVVGDVGVFDSGRGTKEGISDKPVHVHAPAGAIDQEPDVAVSSRISSSSTDGSIQEPHATEARNLIARRDADLPPFLVHHENIAHERVKYNKRSAWQ